MRTLKLRLADLERGDLPQDHPEAIDVDALTPGDLARLETISDRLHAGGTVEDLSTDDLRFIAQLPTRRIAA